MESAINRRITAAVVAHYLETGCPATIGQVSRRTEITGSIIPSRDIMRAKFERSGDLIWTRVEENNGASHRSIAALEPSGRLLGLVLRLAFVNRKTVRTSPPVAAPASVVVSPVRVVG